MNWVDEVLGVLKVLGFTGGSFLAAVGAFYLLKEFFPTLDILFGRTTRFIGWAAKSFRKASISSEIQGAINQVVSQLNSEFEHSIFPGCEVKWVTAENSTSMMQPGKAIVRVSFAGDRDLSTFSAAQAYAQTGVLPRAKTFLMRTTAKAIDLVVTKNILVVGRRSALTVFNLKFKDEDKPTKDTFFKLEDINSQGLFTRVLLQELHYFGEYLGESTPSEELERESEEFVGWLHELATREQEERSLLRFERRHLKVGVILVGKVETLRQKGFEPYLRWAAFYASKEFHLIYLLARGVHRGKNAKEIAKILLQTDAFESLTKRADFSVKAGDGKDLPVTCLALRPNITRLRQIAWEKLQSHFDTDQSVPVLVQDVYDDGLLVDVYGLGVSISSQELSALRVPDVANYFRVGMELSARIKQFSPERGELSLSNVDTETDPKRIIELNLSMKDPIPAIVRRVTARDGFETGVELELRTLGTDGFMPRSKATPGRFVTLADRYTPGNILNVRLVEYRFEFGNYVCENADFKDPWESIRKYSEGDKVQVTIRETAERYLTAELEEGLEGRIFVEEIAWASLSDCLKLIKDFKPGQICKAQIMNVDTLRRNIQLSLKRFVECPAETFLASAHGKSIEAVVSKVIAQVGAELNLEGTTVGGFVPISEISWLYCTDISKFLKRGDHLQVAPREYDEYFNNIVCTIKRLEPNDFQRFSNYFTEGAVVLGEVKEFIDDRYRITIDFNGGKAQAYLHKSEISNFLFPEATLGKILEPSRVYPFRIKRFDLRAGICELSRKKLFIQNLSESKFQYGTTYQGQLIRPRRGMPIIYADDFEAVIIDQATSFLNEFDQVKVFLARIDASANRIEATLG